MKLHVGRSCGDGLAQGLLLLAERTHILGPHGCVDHQPVCLTVVWEQSENLPGRLRGRFIVPECVFGSRLAPEQRNIPGVGLQPTEGQTPGRSVVLAPNRRLNQRQMGIHPGRLTSYDVLKDPPSFFH